MKNEFKPIKQPKTSDLIVREIWSMILRGKLKPGEKLPSERELVKRFNVSIVTLREALKTLEIYGHITKKRGAKGGSIILDITPTSGINMLVEFIKSQKYTADDLIEAKTLIDPLIGKVALDHLSKEDQRELEALIERHEREYNARGASRAGWEFYTLLGKFSGNPILQVISELLTSLLMEKEFSMGVGDLESPSDVELEYHKTGLESHKKVINAILTAKKPQAKSELQKNSKTFAKALTRLKESKDKE